MSLRLRGQLFPPRLFLALAVGLPLVFALAGEPSLGADPPTVPTKPPAKPLLKELPAGDKTPAAADSSSVTPASGSAGPSNAATPAAAAAAAPGVPAAVPIPAGSNAALAGSNAAPVGEVKPEVYYIPNKEGELVPLLGFSYDEFMKIYQLKQSLDRPQEAPQYSLQQMTLAGTSRGDRAELTVVFKVLLNTADWVRVPLQMNKCVLLGPAEFHGSGEEFLQSSGGGNGYVCWIRGPAHTEHELTLKILAPLATSAEETRLELNLPHATVSKLSLHVPAGGVTATASQGAAPEVAAAKSPATGSDISLLGLGGDCWLAWRQSNQPLAQLSGALEATGAVLVRIDGRSVNSDATLSIRSFGAEFDHFQVRLPPGAELVGGRQDGYTLTAGARSTAGLVDVKLDHKTVGPIDVRILTERPYDVTTSKPEPLELAGFDVIEAIPHRQWGYLAVAVAGDWQLDWGQQNRMRQVSDLPDSLRRKDLVAGFEYFGQPNSLVVRVTPRKTRISVDPQYVYVVRENEVRLDARLNYTIRGAKLFKLEVDLPGWELDKVLPDGLIDSGSISFDSSGTITLPLVEPTTGDFTLALSAHRHNSPNPRSIAWTLPQPHADVVGPAGVGIFPVDNIDLTPRPSLMNGLERSTGDVMNWQWPPQAVPPANTASPASAATSPGPNPNPSAVLAPANLPSHGSVPTPSATSPALSPIPSDSASPGGAASAAAPLTASTQPGSLLPSVVSGAPPIAALGGVPGELALSSTALFYRAEQPEAKFAADFAVRQQDVSVELEDDVAIRDRDVSVQQAIDYTVRYVALERLRLEVPRGLLEQHRLKFVVANEILPPQITPAETGPDRMAIELALPRPMIGAFRLEVAYTLPERRPPASTSMPLDLPLAVPRDGSIVNNSATVSALPGIRIEQREGPWNAIDVPPAVPGSEQPLRLTASDAAEDLRLAFSRDGNRLQSTTFVDRAWIQTWLTESVRQDRVVYLFTSNEDQLRLHLPAGISPANVELTLDGEPMATVAGPSGTLVVALPPDVERREHLLQLRYQFADRGPHDGSLVFEAPKWDNHVTVRRTYWQLLLPADEHLLKAAGGLTAEYDWVWNSGYLGLRRVALKDESQLEQWVGLDRFGVSSGSLSPAAATAVADLTDHADNVNRYLFSTGGDTARFAVVVIRRWLLLLIASAGLLIIGLAVIYFPVLRRPRVTLPVIALAIIAAILFPEQAILFGQASGLGCVLIATALVLQWLVNRRPAVPPTPAPISHNSRLERSSTRLYSAREPSSEPATTATSPIVVESPSRSHL